MVAPQARHADDELGLGRGPGCRARSARRPGWPAPARRRGSRRPRPNAAPARRRGRGGRCHPMRRPRRSPGGSRSARSGGSRPRAGSRTVSSVPAISRPSGVSSKTARSNSTLTCSAGSSRYERISSTMTSRSWSISRLVEEGPRHELAQDGHRQGDAPPRHAHVVDGGLAVRRGVERPRRSPRRPRTGAGRGEGGRSLERQVLHEVGAAGLVHVLVARAREDVRLDRDRSGAREVGRR